MPLPANQTWTGTKGEEVGNHPAGTYAFQGHAVSLGQTGAGDQLGLQMLFVNVWGKKEQGEQVFCVEKVFEAATGKVTRSHTWKTEAQYLSEHPQLWSDYDMEPNRDFNVNGGIRDAGGAHLNGSNKLCERNGTIKLAAARELLN